LWQQLFAEEHHQQGHLLLKFQTSITTTTSFSAFIAFTFSRVYHGALATQ
jgi:hypothetical protein